MQIKTKQVLENTSLAEEVLRIYEESIPENERVSIDDLFHGEFAVTEKVAYLVSDKAVGFTFYYKEDNIIYLIWLAVDKTLRNRGLGSQILKTLCENNQDHAIALNIDNPQNADGLEREIRLRREEFYKRNGFKRCGIVFDCVGDEYLPLSNKKLDCDKYMEIEARFFPDTTNIRTCE